MADAWDEATYAGKERAQRSRIARLTPQERLAWLERQLVDLQADGVIDGIRERRQAAVIAAWETAGEQPR